MVVVGISSIYKYYSLHISLSGLVIKMKGRLSVCFVLVCDCLRVGTLGTSLNIVTTDVQTSGVRQLSSMVLDDCRNILQRN